MSVVEFKFEDSVGLITINKPPVNALTPDVREELIALVEKLKENKEIRALVITGAGEKMFVAGADIKDFPQQIIEGPRMNAEGFQKCFDFFENAPYPVIAAINGIALGGGTEFALACDIRIADEKARLGLPEVNLGLIPGLGGTQRMARIVGPAKAKELLFLGAAIKADEALRIGLVHKVVPQGTVLEEAMNMAKQFAKSAGVALAFDKLLVNQGLELPLKEALELELSYVEKLFKTEDIKEGVDAFINKRPAVFKNR